MRRPRAERFVGVCPTTRLEGRKGGCRLDGRPCIWDVVKARHSTSFSNCSSGWREQVPTTFGGFGQKAPVVSTEGKGLGRTPTHYRDFYAALTGRGLRAASALRDRHYAAGANAVPALRNGFFFFGLDLQMGSFGNSPRPPRKR